MMKTDGVIFYLHISQNHFYEKKVWIGHWVSHHADTLYVGSKEDIRVDS